MLTENILLAQNKKLRERVDELEETVRQLQEAREHGDGELPEGLPPMPPLEENVLRAIFRAKRIATRLFICEQVYGEDSEIDMKIVDVIVHHLRRRLTEPHHPKIVTVWGKGYAIDRGQPIPHYPYVDASDVAELMEAGQ